MVMSIPCFLVHIPMFICTNGFIGQTEGLACRQNLIFSPTCFTFPLQTIYFGILLAQICHRASPIFRQAQIIFLDLIKFDKLALPTLEFALLVLNVPFG